jgi:hypothetical protein
MNNSFLSILLLLYLLLGFLGCNSKQVCVDKTNTFSAKLIEYPLDEKSNKIFSQLRKDENLVATKLNDSNFLFIYSDSIVKIYSYNGESSFKLVNTKKFDDKIKLFKYNDSVLIFLKTKKIAFLIKNIDTKSINFSDSITVTKIFDKENYYLIDDNQTKIINTGFRYSFIYNYGIYKHENINYLDSTSLIYSNGSINICLSKYRDEYKKKFLPKRNTFFAIDNQYNIYTIRSYENTLEKYNLYGHPLNVDTIKKCHHFSKYETTDLTDLAYLRKYIAQNEQNRCLELINNNYILIVRKLGKEKVGDLDKYQIILMDKEMSKKTILNVNYLINPNPLIFKDKLYFFSTKLNVIYEYKFI